MANLVPDPQRINNNDKGWSVRTFLNGFLSILADGINSLNNSKADKADIEKVKLQYYDSEVALKASQPNPTVGQRALAGEPYPGTVWVCKTKDQWTNTNVSPTPEEVSLVNYIKKQDLVSGAALDWKLGVYPKGSIVRHNGLMWQAKVDVTSAVPPSTGIWELYHPYANSMSLCISQASTFIFDFVNNKINLLGESSNKIITQNGIIDIPKQDVSWSEELTYYTLVFNNETKLVRAVGVFDSASQSLSVNDYPFAYVLNLFSATRQIFGVKAYTITDDIGTTIYPLSVTSDEGDDRSRAISQSAFTDVVRNGGVKDWVEGVYKANTIVRYNGMLWVATTDVSKAEPSKHLTAWKLYTPFQKSIALFISHATTLTIDLVANKVTLSGESTNKIVTSDGIFSIKEQEILTGTAKYYILVFNSTTGKVSAVALFDNTTRTLSPNDYPFAYVLNLNDTIQGVYNVHAYTLINANGTSKFPITNTPSVSSDATLYNSKFVKWATDSVIVRSEAEKVWLSQAIVDIEFYNLKDTDTVALYGLGKKYGATNLCYLSFIIQPTTGNNIRLYADIYNAFSFAYSGETQGVKTYLLKLADSNQYQNETYGKVIINWDLVPSGQRVVEYNANVTRNSLIGNWTYKKSAVYNVGYGLNKLAKSRSFDAYFDSPQIDSYSSAEGVNSMIPKAPYQDCQEWVKKWDELINNCPLGYIITKTLLTDKVPTDTTESGYLPIYAFNFKPNLLQAGDATGNNNQILPKIIINCSIHGFEKTPSFVTYELIKQILLNWKSHPFLEYLRYNVEFSIIPFANPHGWNTGGGIGTRTNFNGVDLNRNFRTAWTLGKKGESTFGSESPLDQIETQVISEWLTSENREGTVLGIDFHNFHGLVQENSKNYNLVWIVNILSGLGQSCSNVLIKELTTKFKNRSELIPQDEDYYIGMSNTFLGNGMAASQMREIGYLYSCTFEVAQNFRFDANFKGHDSNAMTLGVESFTNFLRVFLSNFIDEYNRVKF